MAVAIDATGTSSNGNTLVTNFTATPITVGGSASALVVCFTLIPAPAVNPTVTWGAQSMTLIGVVTDTTNINGKQYFFGRLSPTTGSQTLSVTWATTSSRWCVNAISFTGTDTTGTSTCFTNFASTDNTSSLTTLNQAVTTNNPGVNAVVSACTIAGTNVVNTRSDTLWFDNTVGTGVGRIDAQYALGTSGSSHTCSWTLTVSTFVMTAGFEVNPPAVTNLWGFENETMYRQLPGVSRTTNAARRALTESYGDPLIEGPMPHWYNAGWVTPQVQPPAPTQTRALGNRRAASMATGDPLIEGTQIRWYNAGWAVQPVQPPNPALLNLARNNRAGPVASFGDPLIEGPLVKFYGWGFDAQPVQPGNPATANTALNNRRAAAIKFRSQFAIFPTPFPEGWIIAPPHLKQPKPTYSALKAKSAFGLLPRWVNAGSEVQPSHLRHPRSERSGSIARGDDGIENIAAPIVVTYNWGFEGVWPQPPNPVNRRGASLAMGDPLIEGLPIQWINGGWEVQSVQPPNPATLNLALNNRRAAATMIGDPGIENPITFYAFGFAYVQPHQPQHPRPEKSAAIAKGDDGIEPRYVLWINGGSQVQPFQPPHPRPERGGSIMPQVNIESVFQTFYPSGFDLQAFQPPHPRPERAGAVEVGEGGIEATFVAVAPQIVNWGFDGVWPQPPARAGVRGSGSIARGDDGSEFPLINFYPAGVEVQSVQPPQFPRASRRVAGIMPLSNVEVVYTNWINAGWAVQPPQPPHPRPERAGAIEVGEGGIEAIYFQVAPQVIPWGWEGIWPQPPARAGVRASGSIARGDDGSEFPLVNFYPFGWPIAAHQPQHPRPEREAAIARGDDGIENVTAAPPTVVNWGYEVQPPQPLSPSSSIRQRLAGIKFRSQFAIFPQPFPEGWQVQPPQPPHPKPERSGSIARGDDGIENIYTFVPPTIITSGWGFDGILPPFFRPRPKTYAALKGKSAFALFPTWYSAGWEVQPPQPPHPRPARGGSIMRGDDGTEGVFVPPVIITYNWGFDGIWPQPPHPRREKFGTLIGGDPGDAYTLVVWINGGSQVQSFQPPHPRPERSAGLIGGDPGTQSTFTLFYSYGWPIQHPQPPHPRPERSGAIMRGDDGIEAVFVSVAPQVVNWGFEGIWPQPPHPRPERFGTLIGGDLGIEATYAFFYPYGWPIQPHQPQHPRPEKFASLIGGDPGTEGIYVNWVNQGWPVQPVQPPHPRPEREGSLAKGEDGTEYVFFPIAPQVINWAFDGTWPQSPHPRPERAGSIAKGDEGIEGTYQIWRNGGWEVAPFQPPHRRPERGSGGIARWEDGIEAKYVFIAPLLSMWFQTPDITYTRINLVHPAGAILPVSDEWFIKAAFIPVFYACSMITAGFGQTAITSMIGQSVVTTRSAQTTVTETEGQTGVTETEGQTIVKGEPSGGPCE